MERKKAADAWRQQAKEEMSKKIQAEYSGSGLVSTENGQRAEYRARSRSARASAKPASSQSSRQAAASERGRRLAMQRKRQERATTLIQRTGAKILDWLRRGAAVTTAGAKALTLHLLTVGGAVTAQRNNCSYVQLLRLSVQFLIRLMYQSHLTTH